MHHSVDSRLGIETVTTEAYVVSYAPDRLNQHRGAIAGIFQF
jgi:hypothetical protein